MNDSPPQRQFIVGLALLTLFAWLVREYFVTATVVEVPIRGDIREYVAYAWNLLNHGTFSHAWPGTGTPIPDTFRGPGYPVFLATWMWLDPENWYQLSLHAQTVLGALTATLTVLLARHWLPRPWAFFAGILVAVWPHHVAATGALLSEVVFGFLAVLALLLVAEALKRRSVPFAAMAGIVFSAAALTSMVSLLFPILPAILLWRARLPSAAAALLLIAVAGPGAWASRGLAIEAPHEQPGRMAMNLVQGSWPLYHRAYASRHADPVPRDIIRSVDREISAFHANAREGATLMLDRMGRDPVQYVQWYCIEKPFLLWDWGIRIAANPGDIYVLDASHSPLETNPVLHSVKDGLRLLNPSIFVLSFLATVLILAGWLSGARWADSSATLVAGFCFYVTLVHVAFQAEPRYSIPYRPMQMMMLMTTLAWIAGRLGKPKKAPPATL